MMSYLLDTNHASRLVTVGHPLQQRISQASAAGDRFHITILVVTETVFGFSTLPRAARNAQEWSTWRPLLSLLETDEADALDAAHLQVTLRRRGRQLGTVDALIAAVALRYSLTLLTTDRDFAAVPALSTANWT